MNNKGFDDSFIERLKFNNDIVSTISRYVTLNQKGKTHWGVCPFHSEKTPSFAVNSYEQYYHCFGCGESGDVIKFIEKIEHVDFMTAVQILAEKAGLEVPDFAVDDNLKEKKQAKDAILKANKDAAKYYNKTLHTEKGKKAFDYLTKKRGLNNQTITRFGLGASIGWQEVVKHLKSLGHSEKTLLDAGLVKKSEKGNVYDAYAERVIFPIINSYGQVIAFSGRALGDVKYAKYLNTAQTLVFDKSSAVYGINLLKKLKQEEGFDYIILVEGQMDVIANYNAGFKNTVACLGTALTKYHAKQIKRFTDKVIVSFDGDFAGQKATFRSLEILEKEGLSVYVITLPNGSDPDEFIKAKGKEAYQKLLDNALPLNDYKLKAIAGGFDLTDSKQVSAYIDKTLEEIAKLTKSSEREIYLKKLADKTKVDVYTLKRDLDYKLIKTSNTAKNEPDKEVKEVKDANYKSAEFVLASLVHKKMPYIKLNKEVFSNANHNKLYDFITKSQHLQKDVKVGDLFTHFSEEKEIKDIINFKFNLNNEKLKVYFDECVKLLELDYLFKTQKQLISRIEKETDKTKKLELMQEFNKINLAIKNKRK